jgi:N-acetylglucosaminyl-diphospho-decaprenol L-rhamnosyltransferase
VTGAPLSAPASAVAAAAPTDAAADAAAWQRIAAIVVTHHSAGVIGTCLRGLTKAGQIVLVDNASDDDTLAIAAREAPHATVLVNVVGVGYGNGVNQALPHVDREFALLANPDSILRPGAVAALVAAADAWPEAALFGPTVFAPDGGVELSHDVPLFDRRAYGRRDGEAIPEGPCSTEFLSGAVMLVRTAALRQLGGFDPAFFLYYEDDDFCLRLRRAGHGIVLVPTAEAEHVGGGSVRVSAHYYWEKWWHMAWSRLYFEEKHRGAAARRRLARHQALRFAGKALGNLVTLDRRKAWRDTARLFGTLGYMLGIRASRTVGYARPRPELAR